MDAEQARELALNARLNHWPPHLGLSDDTARIEHLAGALESIAAREYDFDVLRQERDDLEDDVTRLENEVEDLNDRIKILQDEKQWLAVETEQLREQLKAKQ